MSMELSTILVGLYGACPPVKSHEVQRAHQLIHWLRAVDLSEQCSLDAVVECLVAGGFHREALIVGGLCSHLVLTEGHYCASIDSSRYPRFLCTGLGLSAPPVLWVSGDGPVSGTAIGGVGCRHPSAYRAHLCRLVGGWVANRGYLAVSGGAVGCDQTFVEAAGSGWHFLPCGLGVDHRLASISGVSLGSVWPPSAAFSGYQAMIRNSFVYGSVVATFVFSARCGVGGSWGGAVSALRAKRPVIAVLGSENDDTECQVAMRKLCNLGAIPCQLGDRLAAHDNTQTLGAVYDVLDQCLEVANARSSMNTGLFARTA